MKNCLIRPETPKDIEAIQQVTEAAFLHAAHTDHTEQFIVNALRRAGQLTVSLVADREGQVIGHIALSPVTISDGAEHWYGLGPLSVTPDFQRQGVGVRLVQAALNTVRGLRARGCVVLGDPNYYSRFGFRAEPSLRYPGVPAEYFQSLVIQGTLPTGRVSYANAFGAKC